MTFGLLIWGTSMFASYAVFGHRRALNAVVVVGVFLILNMTYTREDQLPLLVVFSLASLFLLIRSHVFDEQSEWLRRRIGDPASIASVYLRGGTTFIAITVAAAFILTLTASSAPLKGAWAGISGELLALSRTFGRFLPTGGDSRSLGLDFGPSTQISGQWSTSSSLAFTVERNPIDKANFYWRVATYNIIGPLGWDTSPVDKTAVAAGDSLLAGLADDVDPTGLRTLTVKVIPGDYTQSTIVSPASPVKVDTAVRVATIGKDRLLRRHRAGGQRRQLRRDRPRGRGRQRDRPTEQGGIAQGRSVHRRDRVPARDQGALSRRDRGIARPDSRALEAQIRQTAETQAPVDLAEEIVSTLRHSPYEYDTDVRDEPCESLSVVECFARFKHGYCQYYAATMAILLRDMGIPTRIAQGFLPGTRDGAGGSERVLFSNAHAWVEVWFPGYEWVRFDPTGGNLAGQVGPLPSGPPTASATPGPSRSALPAASRPDRLEGDLDGPNGPAATGTQSPVGPFVAVGALLLLAVGAIAFVAWRRGPRGPTTADGAYGMVAWLATRFGFGPRPTQTVYEYAGSLGEVLPDSRPELQTVARAKVESVYARQVLAGERLDQLRVAQRRLRVALLRLAFRRKERRRR